MTSPQNPATTLQPSLNQKGVTSKTTLPTVAAPTPIPPPVTQFDPAAIEAAYKANPHKAQQDYAGLWVEAHETIREITPFSLIFESIITNYHTGCHPIAGQEAKLAGLTAGQRVTVWGEIKMDVGFALNVSLTNCIIVAT